MLETSGLQCAAAAAADLGLKRSIHVKLTAYFLKTQPQQLNTLEKYSPDTSEGY